MSKSKTQSQSSEPESRILDFNDAVPIERINQPERSKKLHPYEDELESEMERDEANNEHTWEEFRDSVGTEPNKPLEVTPSGPYEGEFSEDDYDGDYDIVDGDRRFRALTENDAEEVACFIVDVDGDVERGISMFEANNLRRPNSPEQEARWIARLYQPSLLKPAERVQDEPVYTTAKEIAKLVGVSDATITAEGGRLQPIRNKHYIRWKLTSEYATNGKSLTAENVRLIDEIVDFLETGGEYENTVVGIGQETFFGNELADMAGGLSSPSLKELRTVAEKAAKEGWNSQRFLEYVEEHYYEEKQERNDFDESEIESGMMDGSDDPFEDNDFEDDSGVSVDDVEVDDEDDQPELDVPQMDVNWSDYVSSDELDGSLSEYKTCRMMSQTIEDDASVGINILSDKWNMSQRDVMQKFVEPIIVDAIAAHLDGEE